MLRIFTTTTSCIPLRNFLELEASSATWSFFPYTLRRVLTVSQNAFTESFCNTAQPPMIYNSMITVNYEIF